MYATEMEACKAWAARFNNIPTALVIRAYKDAPEDLELLAGGKEVSSCCGAEIEKRSLGEARAEDRHDMNAEKHCALCNKALGEAPMRLDAFLYCDSECVAGAAEEDQEDEGEDDDDEPTCKECGEPCDIHHQGSEYDIAAWGTMFLPNEQMDSDWIRDNADKVAECGFLVYSADEVGVFIGVDGAGYDFFEAHWLPLYRARGLNWVTQADA